MPQVPTQIGFELIELTADCGGVFGSDGSSVNLRQRHGGTIQLAARALDEGESFRIGHRARVFAKADDLRYGHGRPLHSTNEPRYYEPDHSRAIAPRRVVMPFANAKTVDDTGLIPVVKPPLRRNAAPCLTSG
jgi:hypothetical protein